MQGLLGLGGLLLGAVADHGVALRQVQVERDEGPVLQAQRPQGGAVDLSEEEGGRSSLCTSKTSFMKPGSTVPRDDVCLKRALYTDCDINLVHLVIPHVIYSLGYFPLVRELGCQEEKNLLQLCPSPHQSTSP